MLEFLIITCVVLAAIFSQAHINPLAAIVLDPTERKMATSSALMFMIMAFFLLGHLLN